MGNHKFDHLKGRIVFMVDIKKYESDLVMCKEKYWWIKNSERTIEDYKKKAIEFQIIFINVVKRRVDKENGVKY